MNLYIFWTAKGTEAESQQKAFRWRGSYQAGEGVLVGLGLRVTSWYVSNGNQPKDCADLNLIAELTNK